MSVACDERGEACSRDCLDAQDAGGPTDLTRTQETPCSDTMTVAEVAPPRPTGRPRPILSNDPDSIPHATGVVERFHCSLEYEHLSEHEINTATELAEEVGRSFALLYCKLHVPDSEAPWESLLT